MANEKNLIPINKRSKEEQKEIHSLGGIASGKVRKEKATMRKTLELLLEETNNKGITYRELTTLGLIKGAVNGNPNNYKTILELLGELQPTVSVETPTLKLEIVNNEDLESAMYEEK